MPVWAHTPGRHDEEYGTAMQEQLPQENVEAAYVDEEMIYIHTANNPTSNKFQSIMVRQDILEKIGMTKITTLADFVWA